MSDPVKNIIDAVVDLINPRAAVALTVKPVIITPSVVRAAKVPIAYKATSLNGAAPKLSVVPAISVAQLSKLVGSLRGFEYDDDADIKARIIIDGGGVLRGVEYPDLFKGAGKVKGGKPPKPPRPPRRR